MSSSGRWMAWARIPWRVALREERFLPSARDGAGGFFGVFAVGSEAGFADGAFRRGAVSGRGFGFGKGGRMLVCSRNWRGGSWLSGLSNVHMLDSPAARVALA